MRQKYHLSIINLEYCLTLYENLFCILKSASNMKIFHKLLFLALTTICITPLNAQMLNGTDTIYGNEWIHYDQAYIKIPIVNDGMYRVLGSDLAKAGMPTSVKGSDLRLFRLGKEETLFTSNTNTFGATDYFDFYGMHLRSELDSFAYRSGAKSILNPDFNMGNDTAVYFLTWQTTGIGKRFVDVPNNLTNAPAAEKYFFATDSLTTERNVLIFTSIGLEVEVPEWGEGEGLGTYYAQDRSFNFNAANRYGGVDGQLYVRWSGNLNSHVTKTSLNGVQIFTDTAYGSTLRTKTVTITSAQLATNSPLAVRIVNTASADDSHVIGKVNITYAHTFDFEGKSIYKFDLAASNISRYLEITNFVGAQGATLLYNLTSGQRLVPTVENGKIKILLPPTQGGGNLLNVNETYVLVFDAGLSTNNYKVSTAFTPLNQPLTTNNYIIITAQRFMLGGTGAAYTYANYRSSADGGGYKTAVIDIKTLEDQFGYGIAHHPFAIRNFILFLEHAQRTTNNSQQPTQIALMGKSIDINSGRYWNGSFAYDLPTWGSPASNILLACKNGSNTPVLPIGEISAYTPSDVLNYLDKVKTLESIQRTAPEDLASRDWFKNVLNLSGGGDLGDIVKSYMSHFESILKNSYWSPTTTTFYKNSVDPVRNAEGTDIYNLLNKGVILTNFFGHSATSVLDFDVSNPAYLNNVNRYPFFTAFGCSAGNFFQPLSGISEEFVSNKNKGMIAFMGTSSVSFLSSLNIFGNAFFSEMGVNSYGKTIGEIMQAAIRRYDTETAPDLLSTLQEVALNGDPALRIFAAAAPDYISDVSTLKFNPSIINTQLDSFNISFDVVNMGKIKRDTFNILIRQQLPNGMMVDLKKVRIPAPSYRITLSLNIPLSKTSAIGLNRLQIKLDADNEATEAPLPAAKSNNDLTLLTGELGAPFYVVDNKAKPVYPQNFGIVNSTNFELKSSTSNALSPAQNYIIEIDTTVGFNSPQKLRTVINQKGGVISWKPNITWRDSTVYFWRIAPDSASSLGLLNWENSSFVYLMKAQSSGWNQSVAGQLNTGYFQNIVIDSASNKFIFDKQPLIVSFKNDFSTPSRHPHVIYNDILQNANRGYPDAGLLVWSFDSVSARALSNWPPGDGAIDENGHPDPYGIPNVGIPNPQKYHFKFFAFDMSIDDATIGRKALMDFINKQLLDNNYIMVYTVLQGASSDLKGNSWAIDSAKYGENIFQLLEKQGAKQIRGLQSKTAPYLFVFQKGRKNVLKEHLWTQYSDGMEESFLLPASASDGSLSSVSAGPAKKWTTLELQFAKNIPRTDSARFVLIGQNANQSGDTTLISGITNTSVNLTNIDAKRYPYLKLQFSTSDSLNHQPTQLRAWRIYYEGLPDFALNANKYYSFYADSLQQGDTLRCGVAIDNITNFTNTDSLSVLLNLTDETNVKRPFIKKIAPLAAFTSANVNFSVPTRPLLGKNKIDLTVNPNNEQAELNSFNNFLQTATNVVKDKRNLLLDVTFDGLRILDNDIVSSKPFIKAELKSGSKFIALNDTSALKIFIQSPDGTKTRIFNNDANLRLTFGDLKNNTFTAEYRPTFLTDGTYKLIVQTQDASGNPTVGNSDFLVAFQVITKSSISNVLNYPNPFSTATRFVYTLTGDQTPPRFKIQIMTVSGKVVREITQDELGALKIGTHMTDFVWKGTDEYGDKLANGVYLYRVLAQKSDGTAFDKYDTGTDAMFKKGIGKLVIVR